MSPIDPQQALAAGLNPANLTAAMLDLPDPRDGKRDVEDAPAPFRLDELPLALVERIVTAGRKRLDEQRRAEDPHVDRRDELLELERTLELLHEYRTAEARAKLDGRRLELCAILRVCPVCKSALEPSVVGPECDPDGCPLRPGGTIIDRVRRAREVLPGDVEDVRLYERPHPDTGDDVLLLEYRRAGESKPTCRWAPSWDELVALLEREREAS